MKCPSILNNNNQDINPSVGNLQLKALAIKELVEISNPNKLLLPSLRLKSKPSTIVNESIWKEFKLSKLSVKEGDDEEGDDGEKYNKLGVHDEEHDEETKENHEEINDGFNKPHAKKLKGCNVGKSKKVMKHG